MPLGFTRHVAAELAPARIRVNATCPGPTDTPMLGRSLDELAQSPSSI
ncbi:MAG: SDR family oxidoreductase [Armatimonadetes bacterium]|nr:SDR family oxidoreductase [Armatimonadota bacterium]